MSWRRLITQALVQRSEFGHAVFKPSQRITQSRVVRANFTTKVQGRVHSSYVGNLARRVRDVDEASEVAHLKELHHGNYPEAVIRLFESQPSLHSNPSALAEYVKALVKVDGLNGTELLKTLQRGISSSARGEEGIGAIAAFKNVGKHTKEGVLGPPSAPIHMAASEEP